MFFGDDQREVGVRETQQGPRRVFVLDRALEVGAVPFNRRRDVFYCNRHVMESVKLLVILRAEFAVFSVLRRRHI